MDVIQIIRDFLERCEAEKAEAIAHYNKASIAIETLKELTDLMLKETLNDHTHSEPIGTEVSAKEGARG